MTRETIRRRHSLRIPAPGRAARLAAELLEPRLALAGMVLSGPTDVVFEGERAAFTLRLNQRATKAETVFITTSPGTATFGVDYTAPARQQILFAPGEQTKTFFVSTLKEAVAVPEGRETFFVTATPSNPALSAPLTATVGMVDYVPMPSITVADVTVTEGNSGTTTATFQVTLGGTYPRGVSVAYATSDGSATVAGNDYVATSGTLSFAPGETRKTVAVTVNGDQILEPNETFSLVLSSPVNATLARSVATCTIVNDEADQPGFQITVTYADPNLPASQKSVFERAVSRLQQIIIGDVPGVTLPGGQFIDDMQIRAFVETMDPGINGYARATQFRPGTGGLPYDGEIHINASRIGNPGIYHTIIHETLHALGFYGSFFTDVGKASGLGTNQPLFTGPNAVREYGSAFGIASPTGVPLFGDQSQTGSYGSHWSAAIGTEIMSAGWDSTSTALRPFSRITVGALQDIGYQVNYAAADAYTRPTEASRVQLNVASAQSMTTPVMRGVELGVAKTTSAAPKTIPPITASPQASTTPFPRTTVRPATAPRTSVATTASSRTAGAFARL